MGPLFIKWMVSLILYESISNIESSEHLTGGAYHDTILEREGSEISNMKIVLFRSNGLVSCHSEF
jgi:hypothetical protein